MPASPRLSLDDFLNHLPSSTGRDLRAMRASTYALLASFCLILGLASISIFYVLPSLERPHSPSESAYLEACRDEIKTWRDTKAFERRYTFGKDQPEIDIVYTWVNGSDPEHRRSAYFSILLAPIEHLPDRFHPHCTALEHYQRLAGEKGTTPGPVSL